MHHVLYENNIHTTHIWEYLRTLLVEIKNDIRLSGSIIFVSSDYYSTDAKLNCTTHRRYQRLRLTTSISFIDNFYYKDYFPLRYIPSKFKSNLFKHKRMQLPLKGIGQESWVVNGEESILLARQQNQFCILNYKPVIVLQNMSASILPYEISCICKWK